MEKGDKNEYELGDVISGNKAHRKRSSKVVFKKGKNRDKISKGSYKGS